jgi:hypothetical protein
METRSDNTLETLPAEKKEMIMDLALNCARLWDVLEPLKDCGIEVSLSTLQRFVRRHREEKLLKDGEDMEGTVQKLARRGRGEELRKGTIEALRQKVYEGALETGSVEVAREALGELVQEEAKLKELALAEQKMILAKEQLALQRLRIEVQAEAARIGRERKIVAVESARVVAGELPERAGGDFTEGREGNEEKMACLNR